MSKAKEALIAFTTQKLMALSDEEVLLRLQRLNIEPPTEDLNSLVCKNCGNPMTQNGSCYKCGNCGNTSGCS